MSPRDDPRSAYGGKALFPGEGAEAPHYLRNPGRNLGPRGASPSIVLVLRLWCANVSVTCFGGAVCEDRPLYPFGVHGVVEGNPCGHPRTVPRSYPLIFRNPSPHALELLPVRAGMSMVSDGSSMTTTRTGKVLRGTSD